MSEKTVGSIIDGELSKVEAERKSLEARRAKLLEGIEKAKTDIQDKTRELGTVESSLVENDRARVRVVKMALAEAGIRLEPVVHKPRASSGVMGLRGGAPKEVLAFIVSKGSATTAEIGEHFAASDFAKRINTILSAALKSKGYVTAQMEEGGRGSVFRATEAGKVEVA